MAKNYIVFLCLIFGLKAEQLIDIADAFKNQKGMLNTDPLLLQTFADIAAESTVENPFLLVAIPAGTTYHFFDSKELYSYWRTKNKGDYFDPLNKVAVTSLFVFKYMESQEEFPFEYVETLDRQELTKRIYTPIDFDVWLEKSKKAAADWIMSRLTKKFTKPTRKDLEQIYRIIGVPVDEAVVSDQYDAMLSQLNPFTRYLVTRAERRYTDARLRNFIARRGFPFDEQVFLKRYNLEQAGRPFIRITLTFLHLGHTDYFRI